MSRYRTIVADPPWHVATGPAASAVGEGWAGHDGRSRTLAYPTMSVAEISALPVADHAEDGCHLYLWTINRYIEDAYSVARAWGFTPSTLLTWCKAPMGSGLGGQFGISTEHVLFCWRGRAAGRRAATNTTWFRWKRPYDERGKPMHSGKPEAFYDLVREVSPGPHLELFARRQRLGWDTWGNQALSHIDMQVTA